MNTEIKGIPTLFNNECDFHKFCCPYFTSQKVLKIKLYLTREEIRLPSRILSKKLHVLILAWVIV